MPPLKGLKKRGRLTDISQSKLIETYDIMFDLQHRLSISDEFLLNTFRISSREQDSITRLRELMKAYNMARDNLITWYLKQTKVELNVTISLLTAKIKFIEYKLGECNGLDLHQACSLSLVDFCNILSDMTIHNKEPADRKTMRAVSEEAGIPVWLSHYRNQICHVPSESPCISILVPLVAKSLDYMKETFWDNSFNRDHFDTQRCRALFRYLSAQTHVCSINQQMQLKRGVELSRKKQKRIQEDLGKVSKACYLLRKHLLRHPTQTIDLLTDLLLQASPTNDQRHCGIILEQIILTRKFEGFVSNLINRFKDESQNPKIVLWLKRVLNIVGFARRKIIKKHLQVFNICPSNKIIRAIDIAPVKCCRIAYSLVKIDHPSVRPMVIKLRHKLLPILGKDRVNLLIKITQIAHGKPIAASA